MDTGEGGPDGSGFRLAIDAGGRGFREAGEKRFRKYCRLPDELGTGEESFRKIEDDDENRLRRIGGEASWRVGVQIREHQEYDSTLG